MPCSHRDPSKPKSSPTPAARWACRPCPAAARRRRSPRWPPGSSPRAALADDQEVLIVTLVNSAVDNFARRVDEFVSERGLLPHVGYRVRTLHGLAHDIVRERPEPGRPGRRLQIVDEREADADPAGGRRGLARCAPGRRRSMARPRAGRTQARLGEPRPVARAGCHPGRQLHPPGQGPGADAGTAAGTNRQPVGLAEAGPAPDSRS